MSIKRWIRGCMATEQLYKGIRRHVLNRGEAKTCMGRTRQCAMTNKGQRRPSSGCTKNDTVQRPDAEREGNEERNLGERPVRNRRYGRLHPGGGMQLGKRDDGQGIGMDNFRGERRNNFCVPTRSKCASNGDGSTGLGGTDNRENNSKRTSGMDRREMGRTPDKICDGTYTTQWTFGGRLRDSLGAPKGIKAGNKERGLLSGNGCELPLGEPRGEKGDTSNEDDFRPGSRESNRPEGEEVNGTSKRRRSDRGQRTGSRRMYQSSTRS